MSFVEDSVEDSDEKVTLKYVLSHRNVNEEVYYCDVRRWLGIEDGKKIDEVQELLTKLNICQS